MSDELNTDPRCAFPRLWAKHDPSIRAFVRVSLPDPHDFAGSVSIPQKRVRLYMNGGVMSYAELDLSSFNKMIPGMCRMGNWSSSNKNKGAQERALCGKVDQFSIWQKELTHKEVEELVELGKTSVLWAMSYQ